MQLVTSKGLFVLLCLYGPPPIDATKTLVRGHDDARHDLQERRQLKAGKSGGMPSEKSGGKSKSKIETLDDYIEAVEKLDDKCDAIIQKCNDDFRKTNSEYSILAIEAEIALDQEVEKGSCIPVVL